MCKSRIGNVWAYISLHKNIAADRNVEAMRGQSAMKASTVLAQDHFYSDFLSLSLTILTHKGSMRMILIRCGVESALASATGGMNNRTVDYLNGSTFVIKGFWCKPSESWKTLKKQRYHNT